MKNTYNIHITNIESAITPAALKSEFPITEAGSETVFQSRRTINNILTGSDDRLLAIIGPCSIHSPEAALDYAERLLRLHKLYSDKVFIVMRVYFEKPRTTIGWRGMIIDPDLDGSYNINNGLRQARKLLVKITDMGLPTASEMLDPIIPQFISDLISWAAVGARTTESQTHRNMVSGLSMPVGFKNGTDGSIQTAIDALQSAINPHSFLGIDEDGKICVLHTSGNPSVHLILRGGRQGPNYYEEFVEDAVELMNASGLNPALLVDCSHANSAKKPDKQMRVLRSLMDQRKRHREIKGFMLESNLFPGKQSIPGDPRDLKYGVSITDGCVGWETTEEMLNFVWQEMQFLN